MMEWNKIWEMSQLQWIIFVVIVFGLAVIGNFVLPKYGASIGFVVGILGWVAYRRLRKDADQTRAGEEEPKKVA